MNMMYFFEKIKLSFKEFEQPGNRPNIVHLEKIMTRCLKLYQMIDNFMKIFKLIKTKESLDSRLEGKSGPQWEKEERKRQVLIKRLTVSIWLLLKENPVLPLSFKYKGSCLLEQLKKERDIYKA